jgi:murein DD-endopeptidase MepM/ murein hydrolase activator NlpD
MYHMKKLYRLAAAVLLFLFLTSLPWALISGDVTSLFEGPALNFRIIRLSTMEPDQNLALPVRTVRVKQISDTWRANRPGGRQHQGQDIFARRGTPVYSATEGYVVRIGENSLGGQTVSVIGAGRRIYYYAHLDSYAPGLSVGDHVTTETVVGYVGTTGNAMGTPSHLHFGVYSATGAINPLPLLTDKS